tara:strand:- start:833 stop:1027 length:195 start_codon:yes stop_codon:yes gene_type:complete
MPAAATTKAAIQRAIEATQATGLVVGAVTVSKDGSVRVETYQKKVDMDSDIDHSPKPKQWAARR